jgi:DNA repair protein RecO
MENSKFLTKCIVLSKKNFGEGHIMVTLLTERYGIVKASAFGGQRLSKRFKGSLDYFKFIECELEHKKKDGGNLTNITSVKNTLHNFRAIGQKIERFAAASYIQELCAIILTPNEASGKSGSNYFLHLYQTLCKLEQQNSQEELLSTIYDFSVQLYTDTGFLPELKKISGNKNIISHLQEFNSRILGTAPKSFTVLESVINQ